MTQAAERRPAQNRLATALSGAISGGLVSIVVQPLDVIRTRMQGDGAKGFVRGTLPTIQRVYREYGLKGFWRGTGPTVLRMTIGAGLHFMCVEVLRNLFHAANTDQSHWLKDASIGGLSRGAATIALCPITVIKTRMEYTGQPYRSTLHAGLTIARTDGIRGLFKGVVPTFAANAPFSALHYMFYRKLQTSLFREAAAATVLTQPADVVRTRIQLGMGSAGALASVTTLRQVFLTQGLHGITLGLIWALYEEISPRIRQLVIQPTQR